MSITLEKLESILSVEDLTGFTYPLRGDVWRYVVGLTNNTSRTLDLLLSQAIVLWLIFNSLTIGGRTNHDTGEVFIDVGTSTDKIDYAISLGLKYRQLYIRDSLKMVEIPVK